MDQQPSNYDFILNPEQPKKKSMLLGSNNPKDRLLLMVVAGGVGLILFFLIASMLLRGKNNADALIDIAQRQAEIIRVSDIGVEKGKDSAALNLAVTSKLTVQTSETLTLDRLKKLGKKPKEKDLALRKSAQTDQLLDEAALNNKFDSAFVDTLQKLLSDYRLAVKKVYDTTSSQTEKQILAASFQGVTILVSQKITL